MALCEPEVAVRAGCDTFRPTTGRDRKLCKDEIRSDPANPIAIPFGEPKVAVGAGRDVRKLVFARRDGKLGDDAIRGNAPDHVHIVFGEPQVAVRASRNTPGMAVPLRYFEE
jgi:hypothetical protein